MAREKLGPNHAAGYGVGKRKAKSRETVWAHASKRIPRTPTERDARTERKEPTAILWIACHRNEKTLHAHILGGHRVCGNTIAEDRTYWLDQPQPKLERKNMCTRCLGLMINAVRGPYNRFQN